MKDSVLHTFGFNLGYARKLVADIPKDKMCVQPAGIPNHAAWVLGHLAFSLQFGGSMLGLKLAMPDGWQQKFGNGSKPTSDAAVYPDKQALLTALEQAHARLADAVAKADAAVFRQPTPHEGFRKVFPTIGDALTFMTTAHEATHLGQLSAWRRAAGFPSAL